MLQSGYSDPTKMQPIQAYPVIEGTQLKGNLTGIFNDVLRSTFPNNHLPFELSAMNVQADVERLNISLGTITMGLYHSSIHPMNSEIFPTVIDNKNSYRMRVVEFAPGGPTPVAPGTAPREIQTTEYNIQGGTTRYGLALRIENDYSKLEEGVERFSQTMVAMSDRFIAQAANMAFQMLFIQDPNKRSSIYQPGPDTGSLQRSILLRKSDMYRPHKSGRGFFQAMMADRKYLMDLNANLAPTHAFVPSRIRQFLANCDEIVLYKNAGERGPKILYGQEQITEVEGTKLRTNPPIPDTTDKYDQMTQTSRHGSFNHLKKFTEQSSEKLGWYMYDGTADRDRYFTPLELLTKSAFVREMDFSKEELRDAFHYFYAKAVYNACCNTPGIRNGNTLSDRAKNYHGGMATNVGIFMTYFETQVEDYLKRDGEVESTEIRRNILVAYAMVLTLFDSPVPTDGSDDHISVLLRTAGLATASIGDSEVARQFASEVNGEIANADAFWTAKAQMRPSNGTRNVFFEHPFVYGRLVLLRDGHSFGCPVCFTVQDNFPGAPMGFPDAYNADNFHDTIVGNQAMLSMFSHPYTVDEFSTLVQSLSAHTHGSFQANSGLPSIPTPDGIAEFIRGYKSAENEFDDYGAWFIVGEEGESVPLPLKSIVFMMRIREELLRVVGPVSASLSYNPKYATDQVHSFRASAFFAVLPERSSDTVCITDVKAIYDQSRLLSAFKSETFHISAAPAGATYGVPKHFGMWTEKTFMESNEFIVWRPFDTVEDQPIINLIAGIQTGFTVISKPSITQGGDSSIQVLQLSQTQHMGVIIIRPKRIKIRRHQFYNGYTGGHALEFMTVSQARDFRLNRYQITDPTQACAIVVLMEKGKFNTRPFVFFKNRPYVEKGSVEDYPYSNYTNQLYSTSGAVSEFESQEGSTYQISNVCFPGKIRYMTVNNTMETIKSDTVHGPLGEEQGSREVRESGMKLYTAI